MTDQIKIEQGVPMPAPRTRKYPFDEMNAGDSFFIAGGDVTKIGNAARQWGRLHDRRFSCRNVDGGVRVWRTA